LPPVESGANNVSGVADFIIKIILVFSGIAAICLFLDNDPAMRFIKSTLSNNETIEMEIPSHWTHVLVAWLSLSFWVG